MNYTFAISNSTLSLSSYYTSIENHRKELNVIYLRFSPYTVYHVRSKFHLVMPTIHSLVYSFVYRNVDNFLLYLYDARLLAPLRTCFNVKLKKKHSTY